MADDTEGSAGSTISGKAGSGENTGSAAVGASDGRMDNPLSKFSNYTYRITMYIMDAKSYSSYVMGDESASSKFKIIAQSGGVNENIQNRVTGIPLDLYIDNLTIQTLTATQSTSIPSNSYKFNFQIFEPYGFSFPTQLVKAALEFQANNPNSKDVITALRQHYMLEIKFYGYDGDGKLITDVEGVYKRTFPVMLTKFNFKLDNKVVTYNIEATLTNEQIGKSMIHSTIPQTLTIKADTVINAIQGAENDSGQPGKIQGLMQQLNKIQQDLKDSDKIELMDVYEVEFAQEEIGESELVGEWYLKENSPMTPVKDSTGSNVSAAATQNSKKIDKNIRTITFNSGTSIIAAIDQIISQSKYIEDAVTEHPREEVIAPNGGNVKVDKKEPKKLKWYNITPHIKPGEWDNKRNDYQYTIKYVIQEYEIPYVRSLYIKELSPYPGPHKRYKYWLTGQNTEIISYDQDYNMLYFTAAALSSDVATPNNSVNNTAPIVNQPGQNANPTSKLPGWFEIINSVKTFLYSPGDQLKARIKILGDPDYLMTATGGAVDIITKKRYGNDYSINPNSGQVFIEVDFKEGVDYNTSDGLLEINDDIKFWDYPDSMSEVEGMAYQVIQVTSNFNKGLFTQELKTIVPPFKGPQTGGGGEREGAESQSASVENTEGPNIPESRVPTENVGKLADETDSEKFTPKVADAGNLDTSSSKSSGTAPPAKKSLTNPVSASVQAPTPQGRQVQDDDGSYDRNEEQRLKARANATQSVEESERRTAVAATYQKVPKGSKIKQESNEGFIPTSFRIFDPSTYKKK
jgi:hypothetical protein